MKLSTEKKIKAGIVIAIALIEIILMFFYKEITVYGFLVMFCLYIPDAIVSFIRHDEDKWIDLSFTCIYFVLYVINVILVR